MSNTWEGVSALSLSSISSGIALCRLFEENLKKREEVGRKRLDFIDINATGRVKKHSPFDLADSFGKKETEEWHNNAERYVSNTKVGKERGN
jgi:hypothetical protein